MSGSVRIELNGDGIRELLRDSATRSMLEERAERVADAVRSQGIMVDGTPGSEPLPVDVDSSIGKTRARAVVFLAHPSGVAVESKHRVLIAALSAAR